MLLAAIADIDACQRDPELAMSVNLHGAKYVADSCAAGNVKMLFVSTGAVFDGKRERYLEADPPTPISVYGLSKAMAEAYVRESLPDAIIVRASPVLGRSLRTETNSLVSSLLQKWEAGETVFASERERRNPIDAITLSEWMLRLVESGQKGVFRAGSSAPLSRFEIARAIAEKSRTGSAFCSA